MKPRRCNSSQKIISLIIKRKMECEIRRKRRFFCYFLYRRRRRLAIWRLGWHRGRRNHQKRINRDSICQRRAPLSFFFINVFFFLCLRYETIFLPKFLCPKKNCTIEGESISLRPFIVVSNRYQIKCHYFIGIRNNYNIFNGFSLFLKTLCFSHASNWIFRSTPAA